MSPHPSSPTRRARAACACPPARRCRTPCRTRRRARRRPAPPAPTCACRARRGRSRTSAARRARRSGGRAPCAAARASPSCAIAVAGPSEPGAITPTRVIVARLRISAVIGMSLEQRRPHLRAVEELRRHRLARQAVARGSARAVWPRVLRALRARAKPSTMRGRPSASPPRTIHSNSCACSRRRAGDARVRRRSRSRCAHAVARRYLTAW